MTNVTELTNDVTSLVEEQKRAAGLTTHPLHGPLLDENGNPTDLVVQNDGQITDINGQPQGAVVDIKGTVRVASTGGPSLLRVKNHTLLVG